MIPAAPGLAPTSSIDSGSSPSLISALGVMPSLSVVGNPSCREEHHRHNPALAFERSLSRLIDEFSATCGVDVAAERSAASLLSDATTPTMRLGCAVSWPISSRVTTVDGSIEPTCLGRRGARQQTSNFWRRDPTTDQVACKQQSHDSGYGGDNCPDPDSVRC